MTGTVTTAKGAWSSRGKLAGRREQEIIVVQTAVANYQHAAFALLEERLDGCLTVITGRRHFDSTVQSRYRTSSTVVAANHFMLGRRFLWQWGIARRSVRADVVVVELNPRVLSTWAILATRRVVGRPSIVWGHAWPRRGPSAATDVVRGLMRRLADAVLVYSEAEADALHKKMPDANVIAAPNALYRRLDIRAGSPPPDNRCDFVYVGRLVEMKRPEFLARAFLQARSELPRRARLLIVGDGPLRTRLEELAGDSDGSILLLGDVYDTETLRALYAGALAAVSPGYVGLSIIQSHSFGVPMIIAREELHAPEISAAIEGWNSIMFSAGSAESLSSRLVEIAEDRRLWVDRRCEIAELCAENYSLEAMIARVVRAVESVQTPCLQRDRRS